MGVLKPRRTTDAFGRPLADDVPLGRLIRATGLPPAVDPALTDETTPAPLAVTATGATPLSIPTAAPDFAPTPRIKPHFFDKNGAWRDVLGAFGDALSRMDGGPSTYADTVARRHKEALEEQRLRLEQQRLDRTASRPTIQNVPNVGVVAVDPDGQTARTILAAKSPGQAYAESLGHQPGTPGYASAVADFALKSVGPTAIAARADLQDDRQQAAVDAALQRLGLNQQMADHREGLIRSRPSKVRGGGGVARQPSMSSVVTPILAKMAAGRPLTAGEAAAWAAYKGAGRKPASSAASASPGVTEGTTATGPNGVRMIRRGGKWMPL